MDSHIKALRAITSVYFRRVFKLAVVIGGGVLAVLMLIVVILATNYSPWWWLLLLPLLPVILVAVVLSTILWIAARRLYPDRLNKEQTRRIHGMASKLLGMVATVRIPWPARLALIGKDILRGRPSAMLEDTIENSRSLKAEYDALRKEM